MRHRTRLTNAAAGHPLRRMLPPPAPVANSDDSDWKLFALSFAAFFTCFYTMIA